VATHAPAYGAQVMEWYCTVATINERPCVGPLLRLLWRKASLTSSPSLSEPIEPGSINAMPQWKNRDEVVVAGGGNAIASHAVRPPPRTVTCTYEVRCVLSPRGVTQGCRPRVWTPGLSRVEQKQVVVGVVGRRHGSTSEASLLFLSLL
jgi:hypothetical protein